MKKSLRSFIGTQEGDKALVRLSGTIPCQPRGTWNRWRARRNAGGVVHAAAPHDRFSFTVKWNELCLLCNFRSKIYRSKSVGV